MKVTIDAVKTADRAYRNGNLRDACEGYYHRVDKAIACRYSDAKQYLLARGEYVHKRDWYRALRDTIQTMIDTGKNFYDLA